ncbi:MAG TPA: SAM-dependent methyltransferase [Chitinophagaceae bacterium]
MLSSIIAEKIKEQGPISFHDFMELSLYHPRWGYYTSDGNKLGRSGDYYTSPFLTALFGQMIAKQLKEMWLIMDKPDFTVVEYGAGTGLLCHDILEELKNYPEFYDKLHYCIIEKSAVMRQKQQSILNEKVSWLNSINELSEITGCILSNELLDNFSVHQVVVKEKLMEVFVGYENGFVELLRPASKELADYFDQFQIKLPEGYRTEVNLEARSWLNEISSALKKGFLLTIDYGFPANELYSPRRSSGTLVCYHQHQLNESPYTNIGNQDITAHINFSALHQWGLQYGLQTCGFTNQALFLQGLGLTEHIKRMEDSGNYQKNNIEKVFLIRSLLMDMGTKLKVLIQQKGLKSPQLSGLKFSQPYSQIL